MIGVAALVVFTLGGVGSSLDGRWRLPTQGFGDFTELLVAPIDGPSRMLWLADPSVAPIDTLQSPNGTHYAVTEGGRPFATGRWVPGPYGVNAEIGERLDLAATGETVRLGRLLSAYGIDLVVVVPQLAPAPYSGPTHSPDADPGTGVTAVLGDQLDLQRVTGTPPLVVYRNRASQGPAVEQAGLASQGRDPLDALAVDRSGAVRFDLQQDGPARWTGRDRPTDTLVLAVPAEGWSSETDAVTTDEATSGFLAIEAAAGSGSADQDFAVSYATPTGRRLAILAQLVLAGGALVLAQTRVEDEA